VRELNGITYRSFPSTDRYFGDFADFGFPSDGSAPYNFRTQRFSLKTKTSDGYPAVTSSLFMNHVAVAYLFGVRKITDLPMSLLLVVDHIKEGDKTNFSLANLQIATQLQNVQKGNGVAEAAGAGAGAGAGFFAAPSESRMSEATTLTAASEPLPKKARFP